MQDALRSDSSVGAAMSDPDFLVGGGEMGARIRAHDWAATPLGPIETWPQSLRSALSICLHSSFPTAIYWGPECRALYNDAWAPIPGPRHPWALGRPAREVWADIWHIIEPQFAHVLATGEGFFAKDAYLPMRRYGDLEETYWDYGFTPIRGEDGHIVGVFNTGNETTATVLAERRMTFLLDLADRLRGLSNARAVKAAAAEALGRHLRGARVGYGEIDAAETSVSVEQDWTDGSIASLAGEMRLLDNFGPEATAELRAGRILRIDDTATDKRTVGPGPTASFASIGARSALVVPLVRGGRFAAILYLHASKRRRWSDADATLAQDVAGRTWDAVERARAEAALRASEERLHLALDASQVVGIWDWNFAADRVVADAHLATLCGIDPERAARGVPVSEFLRALHPDERERVEAALRQAIDTREPFASENRLVQADGSIRWVFARGRCRYDIEGRPTRFVGATVEITDQKRVAAALEASHERTIEILESISDAFYAVDRDGRFTYLNRKTEEWWGRKREDLLGKAIWEEFQAAVGSELHKAHLRAAEQRRVVQIEVVSPIRKHWIDATIYPTADGGLAVYFRDITERKEAEARLKLLAREVDHRSKNMLAVVQALVRLTRAETVRDYALAIEGRIAALARVHTLLSRHRWQGADLKRLVEEELAPYHKEEDGRVRVSGPALRLSPAAAQAIAMALHEVATNTARFGALSDPGGQVAIGWGLQPNGWVVLHWTETGGPPVRPPAHKGLGMSVIDRTIGQQLEGKVRIDWRQEGLAYEFAIPAGALERRGQIP